MEYNGPGKPVPPACNRLQPYLILRPIHWNINNGYYNHGTLIVINSNALSGCGTGLVKPALAVPAPETSFLTITTDQAEFAAGGVFIYNPFSDPNEGIV